VVHLVLHTYVNFQLPESHHFVVLFSEGSFIQHELSIL
jgi:hypothetical protein